MSDGKPSIPGTAEPREVKVHPDVISDGPSVWRAFLLRETRREGWTLRMKARARWQHAAEPDHGPIFIVGCPRSGTTLLFTLLAQHQSIRSMDEEGHALWNAYQHPRRKAWSSDRASAEDVHVDERRYLYTAIEHLSDGRIFLDKTPKNVLRLPYLASLFPRARFLFIKRDGRATVSSLIEGWRMRRGISYRLPEPLRLRDYRGRLWSYILPPGWRSSPVRSIPEVAALQYVASNETFLADKAVLSPEAVVEVRFEELRANPTREVEALLDRLELPRSPGVMDAARNLSAYQKGAVSPPRIGKWRDRSEEIESVRSSIAPTMKVLEYEWGDEA